MLNIRNVSQTHDYVFWVLNFLADNGVFGGFGNVKIWSDGCSKHFKTYPTHYFIGSLQERLSTILFSWHFLPPRDAHNRADAAAGNFSRTIQRAIRNTYLLNEIGHLAYISSNMKNWCVLIILCVNSQLLIS